MSIYITFWLITKIILRCKVSKKKKKTYEESVRRRDIAYPASTKRI